MVLAQDAGAVDEDLLVQRDGLSQAAPRLVRACEVVERGKGVGVVLAQDAGAVDEDLLVHGEGVVCATR